MEPGDDSQSDRTTPIPPPKSRKKSRKSVHSQQNRDDRDDQKQGQQKQIEFGDAFYDGLGHEPPNERSIASHDEFVPDVSDTAVKLLITEHNHKFENRIRDILAEAKVSKEVCASVINKHREKESLKQQMRETGDAESTITLEKELVDEVVLPAIAAVPWKSTPEQRSTRPPSINRQRGPDERPRGRPTTRGAQHQRPPLRRNIYEKFQQDLADDEKRRESGALQHVRTQIPPGDFLPSPRIDRRPHLREQPQLHGYEGEDHPIIYERVGNAERIDDAGVSRGQRDPPQPPGIPPRPAHFDERPPHVDITLDQDGQHDWAQDLAQAPAPHVFHDVSDSTRLHDQQQYYEPEPRKSTTNPMDSRRNRNSVYERRRDPYAQMDNPEMFSERIAATMDEYDRWKLTWLEGEMRDLRKKAPRNSGGGRRPFVDEHTGQYYYEPETLPPSPQIVGGIPRRFSKAPVVEVADVRENDMLRDRKYMAETAERERLPRSEARANWRTQTENAENARRLSQRQRANESDYYQGLGRLGSYPGPRTGDVSYPY